MIVYATRGEHGEVPEGLLRPGETLVERRMDEVRRSTEAIGVHRVEFLGYRDSGMMGTPENDEPGSFWRADVDEAVERLAAILRDERPDVLLVYDVNGNYGHPDHLQVHRVGVRAGELVGVPHVLEATMNRDVIRAFMATLVEMGAANWDDIPDLDDPEVLFAMPDAVITTRVDVRPWAERKRASMAAHETQVGDLAPFLAMSLDVFRGRWAPSTTSAAASRPTTVTTTCSRGSNTWSPPATPKAPTRDRVRPATRSVLEPRWRERWTRQTRRRRRNGTRRSGASRRSLA